MQEANGPSRRVGTWLPIMVLTVLLAMNAWPLSFPLPARRGLLVARVLPELNIYIPLGPGAIPLIRLSPLAR